MACIGCRQAPTTTETPTPQPPRASAPLRVLVVDDPSLAQAVESEWAARGEGRIDVSQIVADELVAQGQKQLAADVVIYPSGLLGELATREQIVPLPRDTVHDANLAQNEIFELIRLREVSWDKQVHAVSFGSPQLVLMFREDMFEELGLAPPATWAQYQQLVTRLSDRQQLGTLAPPAAQPWRATIEPLAAGWASQVLLARAASYARHRDALAVLFDLDTMEPLIDRPPYVRALQQLQQAVGDNPADLFQLTPADARRWFFQGRCAMALSWPSGAPVMSDDAVSETTPVATGFAQLPGSEDVFHWRLEQWESRRADESRQVPLLGVAGRLGSVTRTARQKKSAASLLVWLSGREWSSFIAAASPATTLYRQSHLSRPQPWVDAALDPLAAGRYARLVQQIHARAAAVVSIRIPGRQQYLQALDQAVYQTLTGKKAPGEALAEAAQRWQQISEQLGKEKQQRAYEQSVEL